MCACGSASVPVARLRAAVRTDGLVVHAAFCVSMAAASLLSVGLLVRGGLAPPVPLIIDTDAGFDVRLNHSAVDTPVSFFQL